jgi:hypothetical protein
MRVFLNFFRLLRLMRLFCCLLKLKLMYDRQSVGQSVLVSFTHLGPAINFSFSLKLSLDSCKFLILWRPLWREGGSEIYCTIASGPCQSSHSYVAVTQNRLIWDSPNLEGQVPVFLSPRTRGTQLYSRALGSLFQVCCLCGCVPYTFWVYIWSAYYERKVRICVASTDSVTW